jgi:ribosomal protein S18 acetylase RimI-like enzyme
MSLHHGGPCEVQRSRSRNRRVVGIAVPSLLALAAIRSHALRRDWNGMKVDLGTRMLRIPGGVPRIGPRPDWRILRDTILESLATSPDAFLATADNLKVEPSEYWKGRLDSSTWAVVERGNNILGIAAAKPPTEVDDYAPHDKACFIESVWIDPSMRGKGFGEHLVTYLIEEQRRAGIQQFYLWVFDHNDPAIRLYERMNFKPTGQPSELLNPLEVQFRRVFDSEVVDDDEQAANEADRMRDRRDFGITYRLLTVNPGRSYLSRSDLLPVWHAAGSMSRNLKAAMLESRRGRLVR